MWMSATDYEWVNNYFYMLSYINEVGEVNIWCAAKF